VTASATTLTYASLDEVVPATSSPRFAGLLPKIETKSSLDSTTNQSADTGFDHHFVKLRSLLKNSSLWPDGAEAPSVEAQQQALVMLGQLHADRFLPTRIVASAEGGVAICFSKDNKYADIEFLNTGEILGVVSNRRDRPIAWEIEPSARDLARASARIRKFLDASPSP